MEQDQSTDIYEHSAKEESVNSLMCMGMLKAVANDNLNLITQSTKDTLIYANSVRDNIIPIGSFSSTICQHRHNCRQEGIKKNQGIYFHDDSVYI